MQSNFQAIMFNLAPCITRCVRLGCLLTWTATQAAVQYEDCVKRYYGSKSRPQIEIEIEESDGRPSCLILNVLADNGVGMRAGARLPQPDAPPEGKGGLELAGTNRIQGREIRYRAKLSRDRSTLELLEPKSVLLVDGSKWELAGRYGNLSEEARASAAKGAFDALDKELNAVYAKLIATLDPAEQEKLRAGQRRWLKYRDFTVYDGDNANIVGPGTAPHLRQQGRRTLDRIEFLRALLAGPPQAEGANTLYSDGRGGCIAVRRGDDTVLFVALVACPNLNSTDAAGDIPCGLSGLARPARGNTWLAEPGDLLATVGAWKPEPLRLVFEPAGMLRVEAAEDGAATGLLARVVSGSYQRLRDLMPAEEPLRSLLLQLPEKAFEETTEGLSSSEKKSLALTGTGGTFKIETQTQDHLVLRHHDGTVKLLRLAGDDGSVVVAVEQTNVRNLFLQVWRKPRAGDPFELWQDALPKPQIDKFFAARLGAEAAKIRDRSKQVISFEGEQDLRVTLEVHLETPQPDFYFALAWDGYGFALERMGTRTGRMTEVKEKLPSWPEYFRGFSGNSDGKIFGASDGYRVFSINRNASVILEKPAF